MLFYSMIPLVAELTRVLLIFTRITYMPFTKRKPRIFVSIFVALVYFVVINSLSLESILNNMLILLTSMLICVLLTEGRISVKIKTYLIFMIIAGFFEHEAGLLLQKLVSLDLKNPLEYSLHIVILTGLDILIIFFIDFFLQKKRGIFQFDIIGQNTYIILAFCIFIIIFSLTGFSYINSKSTDFRLKSILEFIIVVIGFNMLLFMFVSLYIASSREHYKHMLKTENKLNEEQWEHFQSLLEMEQETRNFRHDIQNHLICLHELNKQGLHNDVETYIKNLNQKLNQIHTQQYNVGNDVVNAILNYHLTRLSQKNSNCTISIQGYMSDSDKITNTDLCTIISNLIQNAVEALEKATDHASEFTFSVRQGSMNLEIKIGNTITNNIMLSNGKTIPTTKSDKRNHGIGLSNVTRTIKNNHGSIQFSQTGMFLEVTVILPWC